jgi:hypothetical protein
MLNVKEVEALFEPGLNGLCNNLHFPELSVFRPLLDHFA